MPWVIQMSAQECYGNSPGTWQARATDQDRTVIRLRVAGMLLLTALNVSGCLSVDARRIRPGVYVIATPASEFVNSEGRARVILNLRAQELCPKGYMRFREDRVSDAKGVEILAWQVSCTT